jgi:hypothetical protein
LLFAIAAWYTQVRKYQSAWRKKDAVTPIDLDLATVIDPGHPEAYCPFGFDQTVEQTMFSVAGVSLDEGPQTFDDFGDRLQKLGLVGIAGCDMGHERIER